VASREHPAFRHSLIFHELDAANDRVWVDYGDGKPTYPDLDRAPLINGVRVTGSTPVSLTRRRGRPLSHHDINCWHSTGPTTWVDAPDLTCRRAALILHALVAHWLGCPENRELRLVSVRAAAVDARVEAVRLLTEATERLALAEADVRHAEACLARAETAAQDPAALIPLSRQAKG
jgi:hypothetical protein